MVMVESGGDGLVDLVFKSKIIDRHGNGLDLSRLDEYSGFDVLVNGFRWNGDEGYWFGGTGFAQGYVKGLDANDVVGREVIGRNLVSGNSLSFCEAGRFGIPCSYMNSGLDGPKRVASFSHGRFEPL